MGGVDREGPAPRSVRIGWPWPATRPDTATPAGQDLLQARSAAEDGVTAAAQRVMALAQELALAVSRLQDAQLELETTVDRAALAEALATIDRARRTIG